MTLTDGVGRDSAGQRALENLISYKGEAPASAAEFNIDLFRELNRAYADKPVVAAPRQQDTVYTSGIGSKRGQMLERKIGLGGLRVLEIGCGDGMLSRALAKEHGCEMVGADIVAYPEWDQPADGKVQFFVHDVARDGNEKLGQFDRVVSFAVFEHIVHPHAALAAAYALLKPGGKAYIYANLYRGAKASHRYREVFFPWPHLLFQDSVWREFYRETAGEPMQAAWVNKLTYDQYVGMARRIGFEVVEHFPSAPYFDEEFYRRFEYQLAAYPRFDLMHDFIHMVMKKPDHPEDGAKGIGDLLVYPPQQTESTEDYGRRFWSMVRRQQPEWLVYEEPWYASRAPERSAIDDEYPWISFPAVDYLRRRLHSSARVFEWGSGGSTLFLSGLVNQVVSIEHDPKWHQRVTEVLGSRPGTANVDYRLSEPVPAQHVPWNFAAGVGDYAGQSFESYVRSIEAYPEGHFDAVIVDGRARMGCLAAAVKRVAPGGMLVLDNANYPRFAARLAKIKEGPLKTWTEIDLSGPGPYSKTPCWRTLAWERPEPELQPAKPTRQERALSAFRRRLADAPLRPYDRIGYWPTAMNRAEAARAMAGAPVETFGLPFSLGGELDWNATDAPRSKRLFLQSWDPFDPLLACVEGPEDEDLIAFLCGKACDWIGKFGQGSFERGDAGAEETDFIGSDTAVSNRFYRLAFLVCAAAACRRVDDASFDTLWRSLAKHLKSLSIDENFSGHSNHGMLQALAQVAGVSRFLAVDPPGAHFAGVDMAALFEQGRQRLLSALDRQFAADHVHKEHSVSYHLMLAHALDWITAHGIVAGPEIVSRVEAMRAAGRWMYDSQGRLANLGDTDLEPDLPYSAMFRDVPAEPHAAAAVFPLGGYWFVKGAANGGAYLAQTASFHSRVHKQADTASFIWRDRGLDILVDAGRYGYAGRTERGGEDFRNGYWYSDPRRIYVESTRAHNTVSADGLDHPRFRSPPFGSAIAAVAARNGIHACESSVPNLRRMSHFRILALRAGQWLLCVDSLRAADSIAHDVLQNFHIHPDWTLASIGADSAVYGHVTGAELHAAALLEGATIGDAARGRGVPGESTAAEMFGWWSPRHMRIEPCNSFSTSAHGEHVTMATLFSFGAIEIDRGYCGFNQTRRRLRFRWTSGDRSETLTIDRGTGPAGEPHLAIL